MWGDQRKNCHFQPLIIHKYFLQVDHSGNTSHDVPSRLLPHNVFPLERCFMDGVENSNPVMLKLQPAPLSRSHCGVEFSLNVISPLLQYSHTRYTTSFGSQINVIGCQMTSSKRGTRLGWTCYRFTQLIFCCLFRMGRSWTGWHSGRRMWTSASKVWRSAWFVSPSYTDRITRYQPSHVKRARRNSILRVW